MKSIIILYLFGIILLSSLVNAVDYSLTDKLGNVNNIINNGCTYNSTGYYVCWDNDYMVMNSSVLGAYTGSASPFALSIWTRFNSTSPINGYPTLDSNVGYIIADNTSASNFFCRYYNPSGVIYHTCYVGGTIFANLGSNTTNAPNVWHNLVVTYDRYTACLYWDGSLDSCKPSTFVGVDPVNRHLRLANNGVLTRDMGGEIGRIDTWNVNLTAADVTAVYANSTTVKIANQVARYDMLNISNGCTVPTYGMSLLDNTNYSFCPGTYDFAAYPGKNIINITKKQNVSVNCNGATFIGSNSLNYTYFFYIQGQNIEIKNCNFDTASVGIYIHSYTPGGDRYTRNVSVYNNTFKNMGGFGNIFTDGVNDFYFYNNKFYNSTNLHQVTGNTGCHAIYISGDVGNNISKGVIYNNYVFNMSASGFKINGDDTISNIHIYNNSIVSLRADPIDDYGIVIADANNTLIENNTFSGSYDTGIVLNIGSNTSRHAMNTIIRNNLFNGQVNAIWAKSYTEGTKIYNNTYSGNNEQLRITNMLSTVNIYENQTFRIGDAWGDYWFLKNFTGYGNFSIINKTVYIYGASNPYDDLKNLTSGVITQSNFVDTTTAIDDAYYMVWGDYGCIIATYCLSPGQESTFKSLVESCTSYDPFSIYLYNGTYNFRNLSIYEQSQCKGLEIFGSGGAILNLNNTNFPFWIEGSRDSSTTLRQNVSIGATSVNVTSTAGFAVGDTMYLTDNAKGTDGNGNNITKEEAHLITGITSTIITFKDPTLFTYNTVNSAQARPINPIFNVSIHGLVFNGTSPTGATACVYIKDSLNLTFYNNTVQNCGDYGVAIGGNSYNAKVYDNYFTRINRTAIGYAVGVLGGTKFTYIDRNIVDDVDEFSDCGGSGFPSEIYIRNNTITNSRNGVDNHPQCYNQVISGNRFINMSGPHSANGYAITLSAMNVLVENNYCENAEKYCYEVDEGITWLGKSYIYNHTFKNNTCTNSTIGCFLYSGNNTVGTWLINNSFDNKIVMKNNINLNVSESSSSARFFNYSTGSSALNALLNLNFTGSKYLYISNSNISLSSLTAPYDDIKNGSTVVASNVNSYSMIIGPGQIWSVGDYTPSNSCTYSGSGDWNINASDNCNITSDTVVNGLLYIYGSSGITTISANVTVYGFYKENNNILYIVNGLGRIVKI